jgi:hypothetical protein
MDDGADLDFLWRVEGAVVCDGEPAALCAVDLEHAEALLILCGERE